MNDDLSDALANININAIADTNPKQTASKEETSKDELSDTLKKLTLATPGTKDSAEASSGEDEDNNRPDNYYESTSDELNDDSDRSDALVTVAYYNQLKSKRFGRCVVRRKIRTIPRKFRKDKHVPLDEAPSVFTTAFELAFLHSDEWHTLKADAWWNQDESVKPSWKEIEDGMAPLPTTPLMRPFDSLSNGNTVEKASPEMVMDLEDFSPLDVRGSVYGVAVKVSPSKSPVFRTVNVQTEVDLEARRQTTEGEVETNVWVVMTEADDECEDEGEESDSSVEFILDNQSPLKTVSTTINGYLARRPPLEQQTWRSEYKKKNGHTWRPPKNTLKKKNRYASKRKAKENVTPSGSGGGISGSNYELANQSNFTLGDSGAYQLDDSNENFPQLTPSDKTGSASKKTHRGPSPRRNKDGTLFFPNTHRGKGNKNDRQSLSAFKDLNPFNKGKGPEKAASQSPAKKSLKPQVVVPPNTSSGFPEDEVDYDNTTTEESDFSIDANLEDDVARDASMAFSPPGPSGIRNNKAVSEMGSPMVPAFVPGHRKESSWANIVSSPKPVRNSSKATLSRDLVIREAAKKPDSKGRRPLLEKVLKKSFEQKGPNTYASRAASSPAAGMSLSPGPVLEGGSLAASSSPAARQPTLLPSPAPMPQRELRYDDPKGKRPDYMATKTTELDATALRILSGRIAKRPLPLALPKPSSFEAGSSRLPVPDKKTSGFKQYTAAAVGLPVNTNPWVDPPIVIPTSKRDVTIGRFPSTARNIWKKAGGKKKKKTGRASYESVDSSIEESLPKGPIRRDVPGANYVEDDKSRAGSEAGEIDDGFTTVGRRGGRVRSGRAHGGVTIGRGSVAPSLAQGNVIGETGAGRSGRGMGDIRGRGGGIRGRREDIPGSVSEVQCFRSDPPVTRRQNIGVGGAWKGG